MKKYFYSDGTNHYGPFTKEELREKGITRDTLVWYKELNDWHPAGKLSELNGIFELAPPPVEKPTRSSTISDLKFQQPPKTWLVESILVTIFCCLPFGIAGIVNASKVESRFYAGDIEGAKAASAKAKTWTTVSFWLGLAGSILYIIAMLAGAVSGF